MKKNELDGSLDGGLERGVFFSCYLLHLVELWSYSMSRYIHLSGIVFVLVCFLLMGCLQEASSERIPVRYTVLVRDGNTGEALNNASVEMTDEKLIKDTL